MILDANIVAKDLIAPAVMIPGDPENRQSAVAKLGERRERAKAAARNDRLPLEPEIEEVAVDDERPRPRCQSPQETNERALDVEGGNTEVRVGDYVTWGCQHSRIVVTGASLHKPAQIPAGIYLMRNE